MRTRFGYTAPMALSPDLSFTESLKSDRRQAFYEHHKRIALAMILIVFLLPLIGVFMSGLSGAISGVVISVLSFYLAPYALLKLGQWFVHS
ncbi:MAG: hypothetical protein MRJ67_16315 [Nitrospirales bacterium]|nr:hypothetical protein [Nitrospira sp.]MDR4462055.1 hypothetical protein [Nitrospirales bacterium]MDR4484403.1 hypothetical protein [Nitrospirales bacterium]